MLVIIEVLHDFSVSESNVSNSHSGFSVITEIDPTPISHIFISINVFIVINLIVSGIEFEVIGGEDELVIVV